MNRKEKISLWLQLLFINPSMAFKLLNRSFSKKSWASKEVFVSAINGINFEFDFKLSPMVNYMYSGSYELETYFCVEKFLNKGDTFIDVGANIGYITALAAGVVGKSGQIHSFEPVSKYFNKLDNLKKLNPDYNITIVNAAASDENGSTEITVNDTNNIGFNSIIKESFDERFETRTEEIKTLILSDYLDSNNLKPSLIKIDTEGFELSVLDGLDRYLNSTDKKPVIYCEVAPHIYPLIGKSTKQMDDFLDKHSYKAYFFKDLNNPVRLQSIKKREDLVFLPS